MARPLLFLTSVDRGVIATAAELFEGRHYPSLVAMCTDALEDEPECVPLLLMRARARMALRRDLDAQADLRDVIRLDPQCALAFRLLGELAIRRDEYPSAATFFREALRLAPGDREAADWLQIADASVRPAAVAKKLPAPATAAGRFPPAGAADRRRSRTESQPRFARGTSTPDPAAHEERPTRPFARGSDRPGTEWPRPQPRAATPAPLPLPESDGPDERPAPAPAPRPALNHAGAFRIAPSPAQNNAGAFYVGPLPAREPTADLEEVIQLVTPKHGEASTTRGRPSSHVLPAKPAPRLSPRPQPRGAIPELPGFGEYLVSAGILTQERLRAAQAYQRSMKVQLSTAIVTLGLATPQRIEWASVAHQSQLARGG
jgi:hypothetical protein